MKELRRLALLIFFIISALLLSSSFQGLKGNAATVLNADQGETVMRRRGMREIGTDDYGEPKANVNPRSGALFTPPSPPSTPPPSR